MNRLALVLLLACASTSRAQSVANTKLTKPQFEQIAAQCSHGVALGTIEPIVQTESAFHVFAISINRPEQAAKRAGWNHHRVQLMRQPHNKAEAVDWMHWFAARGYSVSAGLMQVSTENAKRYGVSPEQLFEPCVNVEIGSSILRTAYNTALAHSANPGRALLDAISVYNSGSTVVGYSNRYVYNVVTNAGR